MKKMLSLATAAVMAMAMMLLTACGVDQEKVKGDWMVDTVAGKSAAEYAESLNSYEITVQRNYHIEEDKATVTEAGADGTGTSKELKPQWRSNGVELMDGDTIVFALELDESKNVLKYKADFSAIGGGEEEVFLKKGTFDFAAAMDEFNAAQQGAVSGDAATLVDGEDIALEEETVEAE